ncbi:MAG: cytochrome c3 family protein [Gemmatimonadaceae bacterium]|nr:cytochrome c3 family protein [Gemmatimonadaceae bacterium]
MTSRFPPDGRVRLAVRCRRGAALCVGLLVGAQGLAAQSGVRATKHNLAATATTNAVRATSENEVCAFCHTPHSGLSDAPLWNRGYSAATYTTYSSASLQGNTGQPNGMSKLCLSCHDGTIALGAVLNGPLASPSGSIQMTGVTGDGTLAAGETNFGTVLSADHPVSFTYDQALSSADGELLAPSSLVSTPLKLFVGATPGVLNTMQCSTCHDPHTSALPKFLRQAQRGPSANLCLTCHTKTGWTGSTHQASTASVLIGGVTATVGNHSCMSCHAPHTVAGAERLLRNGAVSGVSSIEATCYQCHTSGSVGQNIQAEAAKVSKHPIANSATAGRHRPMFITPPPTGLPENVLLSPGVAAPDPRFTDAQHVECVDCHNAHRATKANMLAGTSGIDLNGSIVTNPRNDSSAAGVSQQHTICFRCHGDSYATALPSPMASGLTPKNKRSEFQTTNSAVHPIGARGRNLSTNLNAQLTAAGLSVNAVLKCTDCHNSNAYSGIGRVTRVAGTPSGPHGSTYSSLFRANYRLTLGATTYSSANFTLCFRCHNETALRGTSSNFRRGTTSLHDRHLRAWAATTGAICATCHYNQHSNVGSTTTAYLINGVTYTTPPASTPTRLVNFHPNVYGPGGAGTRAIWALTTSTRQRSCSMRCHAADGTAGTGEVHSNVTYIPPVTGDVP